MNYFEGSERKLRRDRLASIMPDQDVTYSSPSTRRLLISTFDEDERGEEAANGKAVIRQHTCGVAFLLSVQDRRDRRPRSPNFPVRDIKESEKKREPPHRTPSNYLASALMRSIVEDVELTLRPSCALPRVRFHPKAFLRGPRLSSSLRIVPLEPMELKDRDVSIADGT